MKKFIAMIALLAIAGAPLFAVEISANFDMNYFVETTNDDTVADESYFGEVASSIIVTGNLADGLDGKIKLALKEMSNGIDTEEALWVEEFQITQTNLLMDGLNLTAGKMEVAGNLDIDNHITHNLSNAIEIDEVWGVSGAYTLDGIGTFTLTTFEGEGGTDTSGTDPEDEDTGLFQSMALQYDTAEDAFGVDGLRLVVAYEMIANNEDEDDATVISLGSTYTMKDLGLKVGLEIDMLTDVDAVTDPTGVPSSFIFSGMLMALNVEYTMDVYTFGLTYETLAMDEDAAAGIPADNTTTRLALGAKMAVGEKNALRFEFSSLDNDEDDDMGGSMIAIGFMGKM